MEPFGQKDPFSGTRDQRRRPLLDARTVLINEALTSPGAGQVSQQLVVLNNEPYESVLVVSQAESAGCRIEHAALKEASSGPNGTNRSALYWTWKT